jgi:hypothetical protein
MSVLNFSQLKKMPWLMQVGLLFFSSSLFAKEPDCSRGNQWPANMALVHLKNAGMTDSPKIDFEKTVVKKLASRPVQKNIYHQIHLVELHEKSGKIIQVITANDATSDECSGGPVDVYVISKHLGGKE